MKYSKDSWRKYLVLGASLWVLGVAVQILALAEQTDPHRNVGWAVLPSTILTCAAAILVLFAYFLYSGGGARWLGYVLLVLGFIFTTVLLVLQNLLADLFMPRVATPGMLLLHSLALIFAAGIYPSMRKAFKKTLAAPPPAPANPGHS
ncbi:MAG: hypothetical protein HXY34_12600 [Candidatus Thorarchaeota archaeon]|nr:hypothetical protein [Candidatus Thorarchaeota archaeon]